MKYEIDCKCYLTKQTHLNALQELIYLHISFAIARNNDYAHKISKYCFSLLEPIEFKDKIYKINKPYFFKISCLDSGFAADLAKALIQNKTDLVIKSADVCVYKQTKISKLISIAPCVITIRNGTYWTQDGDTEDLKRRLENNLQKKYGEIIGQTVREEHCFIENIKIMNNMPIKTVVKNMVLGNKFEIVIRQDELSQNLAFTALSCGIGEKNALGFGFVFEKGKND